MASIFRSFVKVNQVLSAGVNRLLLPELTTDGNKTFLRKVVPSILEPGMTVYDIGGGSQPCISLEQKKAYSIRLVGLDISDKELEAAQKGLYDRTIVADICTYSGQADADIVVCQAVLEHVADNRASVDAISRMLKPGGKLYVFVPCRNALYARLNMALPQKIKEKLLETFFPGTEDHQGFPAVYDRCTPRQLGDLAEASGLKVREIKLFWMSSYFMVFLPAFLLWSLWQVIAYVVLKEGAAETFILVAEKERQSA